MTTSSTLLRSALLGTALVGCVYNADDVTVSGTVFAGPDSAVGVGGAVVTLRDAYADDLDETTADDAGTFTLAVPAQQIFHLELSAEGYAPTAVSGATGTIDMAVTDGTLWMRTDASMDALRAEFGDCATAAGDGAVAEGEMRLYIYAQEADDLPLLTTGTAVATDSSGNTYDACYLDDEGAADPEADVTGQTGRFAIFGLPADLLNIELSYEANDVTYTNAYVVYVTEGALAPMYPAYVEGPT